MFRVYTTADKDEIGIKTLVGEYAEEGMNHGRKYYKKTQRFPGHEEINVYLYYWDTRDGPSFTGWWLGNQVGGSEVWSRSSQASQKPPRAGWRIPWDGEVKNDLVVAPVEIGKQAQAKAEAKAKMDARRKEEDEKQGEALAAEWEERVERATLKAAEVEMGVTEALEVAKEAVAGDVDDGTLLEAHRGLATQATSLAEVQRAVAMEALSANKAPPALKAEMTALGQRLRQLQATVKEQLLKLKNGKQLKAQQAEEEERRTEDESRERELEEGYAKQLEEMLPPAMEKTDAAEDEVEKVAIAAAPLQIDSADDLRPVMLQAIKETEQRVRAAQTAIGEARRYISGKLAQVGRFAPIAKKTAVEEFTTLQARLAEVQNKLNPFKTVRQDYEQRVQAKKLYDELSAKVSGAEIEVEKAAMMTAPLGGDSAEGMKETEAALAAAQSALSQTARLMDSKLKGADKGASGAAAMREDFKALQDRAKAAQEKLDEVRRTVKETQVRVAADALLKEVSDKVSGAEDELQKMAEAELPFLRGEQKGQDMEVLIAEADKVASKVHTALAEAQTFVAKKLVEVARFSEGPAKAVKDEIDMLQKRLEDGRERLQHFRSSTADRKRAHLLEEVEAKVKAAEEEVVRMAEATQALSGLGAAGEAAAEGGAEAVEQANLVERSAQAGLVVARKHLLQKTADLKKLAVAGGGSGSELGRLQTRVNHVQQEVAKLRNITKDAEERLRVKQMLSEVAMRLQATEGDVDKVAAAAVASASDEPSAEQVERVERAVASAQNKLGTTAKLVDVKLKSAQGILREELQGMRNKISAAEKKLFTVVRAAKEQKERMLCSELLAEATERVQRAEAEVHKTGEAELPFLKGLEVATAEADQAIVTCEVSAAAAQKAVADARTFLVQKLLEVKEFSEGPAEACGRELTGLQKRLDAGAAKLAELKRDTAERKRAMQMQASREKVASVEAAVQKLATAMAKLPDDRLAEMSSDEAGAVCEELAGAEAEAQASVADAKKFLALRVQDAKTSADAARGPLTADLAKLQARLTQGQVELAKLSRKASEQEQRFVAQRLLQAADANLAQLRRDAEHAAKVVQELAADDRTEHLTTEALLAVSAALLAHRHSSGATAEALFASLAGGSPATAAELVAWLVRLPELIPGDASCLPEERAAAIAARIAGQTGGKISAAKFGVLLRERYTCTASTPVWDAQEGGQEVGKVEEDEGLELLTPVGPGLARARCALLRDGTEAWVPLESLRVAPPFVGRLDSMEAFVKAVHLRCAEASKAADQKFVELSQEKSGPLLEVKAKFQDLRTVLGQERASMDALRKRASAAKAALVQQRQEEVQQVQESLGRAFAAKSVAESTAAVQAAEDRASTVIENAKATNAESLSISQLDSIRGAAEEALQGLTEAKAVVVKAQEGQEAFKGASRKVLLEARVELTKLASRLATAERKLRAATETVRTAYAQLVKNAVSQARGALRAAARKSGKSTDELFDQVSRGGSQITEGQFSKFVEGLPDHGLDSEQVALVYREFGPHGLRKPDFAKALQEFRTCARGTAIASSMEASADTVRKLEPGELFEVLEGPIEDADTQVHRVRGRALRDGAAGWATMKDGKGFLVLKPREKPFLYMAQAAALQEGFDPASAVIRELQRDEVLELLEGPRPQEGEAELELRARACQDSTSGWITLRDAAGTTFASQSQTVYVCRSTIAMTDVFDIQSCRVLRKVDVGEALEVLGGQQEKADPGVAITRLQFRAARDGKEGWVTLTGNQGTVYVEASSSHYVVGGDLALRAAAAKDSQVVRRMQAGDILEAEGPPQEAEAEASVGLRGRALEDGKAGWVIFSPGPQAPVRPWKPKYICKAAVDVTPALELQASAAGPVRRAQPGETFLAAEGPAVDPASGLRRLRLGTVEGSVLGWATIRAAGGQAHLEVA